jgi:predicted dehydrogenase
MFNFGVIGAGNIANTFSLAMQATKGTLYAVASRSLDKAKDYQEKYGYKVAYGSYLELVEDQAVDCVYIATPHGLHYEHMKLAITHHKHVLCEKSFTLNAVQAHEILELAKKHNVFVMEAMWTRFLPVIKIIEERVKSGIIGDIEKINVSFGFDVRHRTENRLVDPKMGGGALLDVGVYPITLANIFLGAPTSVETRATLVNQKYDIRNHMIYHYPHAVAFLESGLDEELDNHAHIYGSNGRILIEKFWMTEKASIFNKHDELIETIHIPHLINGFEYEINEVIACVTHKKLESNVMTHDITLSIMKQMDELRKIWNLKFPTE